MNVENFQPEFNNLLMLIQSLVAQSRKSAVPDMMLMQKWVPLEHAKTETGLSVSRSQRQYFQKEDWFKTSLQIFDKVKEAPQYETFREKLSTFDGKNHDEQLSQAVPEIVRHSFKGKLLNSSELLGFFLKSISNEPVPAWSDIDVYGVSVKDTQNIAFDLGDRRFTFRQLEISDFVHESYISANPRFKLIPPNSILRIEMNAWQPLELQLEALKMTAMLRLFGVCSAKFGRQTYETKSPFTMIVGSSSTLETFLPNNHPIVLTAESLGQLQRFWKLVEPKLPVELREFGAQKPTTVSIAYERYCDGLLTNHPIERKITFAIMGLEAIYLRENEIQELMYRLQLRICKALSKLDFKSDEMRMHLKEGYKIRNSYVHGGHLSDKEKKQLETKRIAVNDLANKLLNYLRTSILHLIVSKQPKEEFLDLLEESFIERSQDEVLRAVFESESVLLK